MEQRKRAARRSHPATVKAAWALALCCAWLAQPAHARQTPVQQAQAQQSAAREQGAATQRQTRKTDQANRAASVEDETGTAAQAARTAQSETAQFEAAQRRRDSAAGSGTNAAAPSYGPVLTPRAPPGADPARKDPAEVHDETDSLTRQAPARPPAQSQTPPPALPRHPARQPATEPMAPRPLRPAEALAGVPVAVPAPVPAPQPVPRPVRPGASVIGSCQGNSCTDVNGNRYNGIGTGSAGVDSSGRLCARTGVTVQCF
jgi:hypothetical protein